MLACYRPPTADEIIFNYLKEHIEQGVTSMTIAKIAEGTTYSESMVRRVIRNRSSRGEILVYRTRGGRPLRYALPAEAA
jgi:hypothetical protein